MNARERSRDRLVFERTLEADVETVWRAWTDPEQLKSWWAPPGGHCPEAELDLRVGGTYRLVLKPPLAGTLTIHGTYLEIDPPHRLVLTADWEGLPWQPEPSRVIVELSPEDGQTRMTIVHENLTRGLDRTFNTIGWLAALRQLRQLTRTA